VLLLVELGFVIDARASVGGAVQRVFAGHWERLGERG
jgi:hypothetical protein